MHWGLVPAGRCVPQGLARNASEEVYLKVTVAQSTSTTKLTPIESGQAKQVPPTCSVRPDRQANMCVKGSVAYDHIHIY